MKLCLVSGINWQFKRQKIKTCLDCPKENISIMTDKKSYECHENKFLYLLNEFIINFVVT